MTVHHAGQLRCGEDDAAVDPLFCLGQLDASCEQSGVVGPRCAAGRAGCGVGHDLGFSHRLPVIRAVIPPDDVV